MIKSHSALTGRDRLEANHGDNLALFIYEQETGEDDFGLPQTNTIVNELLT